ncbi:MAG: MoeZ/MoeB [Planctomycetes bacterium RBG_16_64_10]|nr:MAG: MoeZ/MoeB [Planctomycetes bacterium RBG_16_64_10]
MLVKGFGPPEQERLKAASVLISRVGGVGGAVAYQLAAAGVGRLVLAHAGATTPSDLNRQLLMTYANVGQSRVRCAAARLKELNPRLEVVPVPENVGEENVEWLVGQTDLIVDCAPRFEERFTLNCQAVAQGKPLIECPMYELEAYLTTMIPGRTPCLACLWPDKPPQWTRQFPVFGAVAGTIGCLAAMEAIKLVSGLGEPLLGRLMTLDLYNMTARTVRIARRADCPICGHLE